MIDLRTGTLHYHSTIRQRAGLWRQFERALTPQPACPATDEDLLWYLTAMAHRTTPKHVRDVFRVIRDEHTRRGYLDFASEEFKQRVELIARTARGSIRMPQMLDKFELQRVMQSIGRAQLVDLRDAALILLYAAGWLKREECVNILIEDIDEEPERDGLRFRARGRYPREVAIPRIDTIPLMCPVRAVNRYLRNLHRFEGPLFPRMNNGAPQGEALTEKGLQKLVDRRFKSAGVYRPQLGAGSIRTGGLMLAIVGRRGRHSSDEDLERHAGWRGWDTAAKARVRAGQYFPADWEDI